MIVPIIFQRVAFFALRAKNTGAIAQLGERVLCKHEVVGSIPSGSTIFFALSPVGCLRAALLALRRLLLPFGVSADG